MLEQLYFQLKRDLGRRYRIDPTLPDQEYIELLAQVRPDLDTTALFRLFKQIKKTQVSEKEMIQLARQASSWITYSTEHRYGTQRHLELSKPAPTAAKNSLTGSSIKEKSS